MRTFRHILPTLRLMLPLLVFLSIAATARAQDRWALVLGVSRYDSPQITSLPNTLNDARTIASSLNTMGFKVYYLENAAKSEILAAMDQIGREQPGAEVGIFYFAGHAIQLDGQNLVLPSDIRPTGGDALRADAVSVNDMVARMNAIGTKSLVVVLDACRNSPLPGESATGTGLALVDAPLNTIIAYATAPGAVAYDGAGANSPYTAALASALEGAEQDFRDVLRLVRARVRLATGGTQTPWYIDNTKAPITIRPKYDIAPDVLVEMVSGREISLETTAWLTIAESADPRDFEEFIALFPEDQLVDIAKRQLVEIDTGEAPDFPLMDIEVTGPEREIPGGLMAEVTACDILATGVADTMAVVEPVPHDLVNTRAALRACVEAVRDHPLDSRLMNHLARVLRLAHRFDEALHYYEMAADLGNPTAYVGISEFYRQGIGVTPDHMRAFTAARTGALLGSPGAQLMTGIFFREGWGVEQSYPEAMRWMALAVQNGFPHAYVAYGDFFRKGLGVAVNEALAVDYYRKAAVLGSSDAENLIGMAYMRGKGAPHDTDTGINWLVRSSDAGNPYAAFQLGRAFQDGWGVEKNLTTALAYFRLSAQRNYLGAHILIGDILRDGLPGQAPNRPEAYANYIIAREAALLRDTRDARDELIDAEGRIAEILAIMTVEERAAGEQIATDWINQYGLLDFNLVSE